MAKKVQIRKAIQVVFPTATDVKLKKMYAMQGEEKTGFFNVDDKTYYVSYKSMPNCNLPKVMYRTAKDRKDFTGGTNTWDFEKLLLNKGYCI